MGKTQLCLTFTHIRTYWKIEAIINYFVTMKVFIILCIVIGISAGFSVGSPVEREAAAEPAAVQGTEPDLYRQRRDLAGKDANARFIRDVDAKKSGGKGEELKVPDKEVGFGVFGSILGGVGNVVDQFTG